MGVLKKFKALFAVHRAYLGSEVLYASGYKNVVVRLLNEYQINPNQNTDILDLVYWGKLFKEIKFDLMHFNSKEIVAKYEKQRFNEHNIAQFFDNYLNFDEAYVTATLNTIRGYLKPNHGSKTTFLQKNFLKANAQHSERELLNKVLVMMQICVNFVEKNKFNTRYLVESAPLYFRDEIGLPAIGSPFNISLLMGVDPEHYGFYLGMQHCSAIHRYMEAQHDYDTHLACA